MRRLRLSFPAVIGLLAIGACSSGVHMQGTAGTGGTETTGPGSTTSGTATGTTSTTTTGTGGGSTGSGTTTSTSGTGGAACVAGQIQCSGTMEQICDANGMFANAMDCAATGQLCDGSLGCVSCLPGTGTCNGQVGSYCSLDGTMTLTETCDPLQGTTCNAQSGRCDGSCGPALIGKSYIGCDYFPTVTANLVSSTFDFAAAVSNTTSTPATVTVTQGAATITTVTVAAGSVQVINMPWVVALKGPDSLSSVPFPQSVQVPQGAYRLRSTQPVTVYQFNPLEYTNGGNCLLDTSACSFSNDASLLLPVNAWTGTYRVVARHHFYDLSGFYAVTAAEDGTTVTVAPGPGGGIVKGGIAGIDTSGNGQVVLNAGDVIEVVTDGQSDPSDPDDVTGSLVTADKPVQVIAGHQCTYIPDNTGYCDHIEESMFPYETLANDYLVAAPLIPTGGQVPKVEMVRIVATQPNTTLTYDPPQNAPSSIGAAGEWIELADNAGDFRITANQPILVAQYMEGQDAGGNSGDPAMALAVSSSQFRGSYLFHAPTNYETTYANIIAPTGAPVVLDGTMVAGFTPIGGSGYSVARVSVSNAGSGDHTAVSPKPFGISVYGYGQYTSYWYPGGLNLTLLHM